MKEVENTLSFNEYLDDVGNQLVESAVEIGLKSDQANFLVWGTIRGMKNYYKGTKYEMMRYKGGE
jgi:hypothetical protein